MILEARADGGADAREGIDHQRDGDDLADDDPVEQHLGRGEVLLDSGLLECLAQVFDLSAECLT